MRQQCKSPNRWKWHSRQRDKGTKGQGPQIFREPWAGQVNWADTRRVLHTWWKDDEDRGQLSTQERCMNVWWEGVTLTALRDTDGSVERQAKGKLGHCCERGDSHVTAAGWLWGRARRGKQLIGRRRERVGRIESKVSCGTISRNEHNLISGPLCSGRWSVHSTLQVVTFLYWPKNRDENTHAGTHTDS